VRIINLIRYADLLDIMMQRATRLGLVSDATKKADAAELELYLFQALLDITEASDLPAYTVQNTSIVTTAVGIAQYPMPDDYGRLIMPRVQNKRGIYVYDTFEIVDLTYIDPNAFARQLSTTPSRPEQFTITQRTLSLFPTPDTTAYTIRGVYIQHVDRPDLDDDVLIMYPTALIDEALFRLASDMNRVSQSLSATRAESMARLLAGSR
jgi:hypothetical protein